MTQYKLFEKKTSTLSSEEARLVVFYPGSHQDSSKYIPALDAYNMHVKSFELAWDAVIQEEIISPLMAAQRLDTIKSTEPFKSRMARIGQETLYYAVEAPYSEYAKTMRSYGKELLVKLRSERSEAVATVTNMSVFLESLKAFNAKEPSVQVLNNLNKMLKIDKDYNKLCAKKPIEKEPTELTEAEQKTAKQDLDKLQDLLKKYNAKLNETLSKIDVYTNSLRRKESEVPVEADMIWTTLDRIKTINNREKSVNERYFALETRTFDSRFAKKGFNLGVGASFNVLGRDDLSQDEFDQYMDNHAYNHAGLKAVSLQHFRGDGLSGLGRVTAADEKKSAHTVLTEYSNDIWQNVFSVPVPQRSMSVCNNFSLSSTYSDLDPFVGYVTSVMIPGAVLTEAALEDVNAKQKAMGELVKTLDKDITLLSYQGEGLLDLVENNLANAIALIKRVYPSFAQNLLAHKDKSDLALTPEDWVTVETNNITLNKIFETGITTENIQEAADALIRITDTALRYSRMKGVTIVPMDEALALLNECANAGDYSIAAFDAENDLFGAGNKVFLEQFTTRTLAPNGQYKFQLKQEIIDHAKETYAEILAKKVQLAATNANDETQEDRQVNACRV